MSCSYGYKLCIDGQYSKPYETYFGQDAIDKFLNDMIKKEYCSKIFETEFNKPIVMTKKAHKDFEILLNVGYVKKKMKKVK